MGDYFEVGDRVEVKYGYGWDGPAEVLKVYGPGGIQVRAANGNIGAFAHKHLTLLGHKKKDSLTKDSVVKATNYLKGHSITITGARVAGLAQIIEEAKHG